MANLKECVTFTDENKAKDFGSNLHRKGITLPSHFLAFSPPRKQSYIRGLLLCCIFLNKVFFSSFCTPKV